MALETIADLPLGDAAVGTELLEVSQLSATVTITGATISALASDNSFNDSAAGFVTAGFAVGDHVNAVGFTGNVANNIVKGVITALTTAKMTIGGTDGDVIVDDAAGESVTISKWVSRRLTAQDIADLAGSGLPVGGADGDVLTKQSGTDFDADWEAPTGGGGGGGLTPTETAHDFEARASTGGGATYNGGIWFGNLITIDETGEIDSVICALEAAETGINFVPVIYANNAGAAGALLAQGPQVNDGAVGDNVLPLTAPLAVEAGDVLWIGCYQANTGGIFATYTSNTGGNSWYFIDSPPANDPGGALTDWGSRLRIFGRGITFSPGVEDAPWDGTPYVRQDGDWIPDTGGGSGGPSNPLSAAWLRWEGGVLHSSFNVASVTKPATGIYQITFTDPVPKHYVPVAAATFGAFANNDDVAVMYGRNSGNPDDPNWITGITLHMRQNGTALSYDVDNIRFAMMDMTATGGSPGAPRLIANDYPTKYANVTLTQGDSGFLMEQTGGTGGQPALGYAVRPALTNDELAAKVTVLNSITNFQGGGLCFRNSASGDFVVIHVHYNGYETAAPSRCIVRVDRWTGTTSTQMKILPWFMNQATFRVRKDATTVYFDISGDGAAWTEFYSEAISAFIGTADQIGFNTQPFYEAGSARDTKLEIAPVGAGGSGGAAEPSLVVTEATTARNILAADASKYVRYTSASAKTLTVQDDATEPLPDNGEWHIRNAGAGDLTIGPDIGVTINTPAGGTLVLEEGMTATLKRVAADEFDLIGQTVPL